MKTNYIIAAIVIAGIAYWYFYVSGRKGLLGLPDFVGDNGTGGNGTGGNGTGSDDFVIHVPVNIPPDNTMTGHSFLTNNTSWTCLYSVVAYANTPLQRPAVNGQVIVLAANEAEARTKAVDSVRGFYPALYNSITITSITQTFSRN